MNKLKFALHIEDGWPPVAVEALPYSRVEGGHRIEVAPLFVRDLSAGDVISATLDNEGNVSSWNHLSKSGRTTIWLLRIAEPTDIDNVLQDLRALGCNTTQLPQYGCYAIDVPADVAIEDVDARLARLDESHVAVAFPSFRHEAPERG